MSHYSWDHKELTEVDTTSVTLNRVVNSERIPVTIPCEGNRLVQAWGIRSDGQAFYHNQPVKMNTPSAWQAAKEMASQHLDKLGGI